MSLSTEPTPGVTDAMITRLTVRDFLKTPVPGDVLRDLLTTARQAPSGGNLQPWKLHVLTGDALAAFTQDASERTLAGETEAPTHPAYPSPLWEPQRSWRYKLGEDMYALLGIPREDKPARIRWFAENAKFFGAPVGIIITGDMRLAMPQHMDIGIFLQSVMLLARERGLHSAPQGWWRTMPSLCAEHLDIDEGEEVLVGLGLGFANPDAPVNQLIADRADLSEVAKFYD